ncbi:hypothetical protein RUND412_001511 [Rhizina undulata]
MSYEQKNSGGEFFSAAGIAVIQAGIAKAKTDATNALTATEDRLVGLNPNEVVAAAQIQQVDAAYATFKATLDSI